MTILESTKNRNKILKNMTECVEAYAKSNNNMERGLAMANMFLQMRALCDNDLVSIDSVIAKAKIIIDEMNPKEEEDGQESKEKSD